MRYYVDIPVTVECWQTAPWTQLESALADAAETHAIGDGIIIDRTTLTWSTPIYERRWLGFLVHGEADGRWALRKPYIELEKPCPARGDTCNGCPLCYATHLLDR